MFDRSERASEIRRVLKGANKILIVDDELDIRETLADLFVEAGFEVLTAAHGAAALELMQDDALPCVVVLDLIMPVLDGNQLYARMQNDPRLKTVPVIVSSSDVSRAPLGLKAFRKPINFDRLLEAVNESCGAARSA